MCAGLHPRPPAHLRGPQTPRLLHKTEGEGETRGEANACMSTSCPPVDDSVFPCPWPMEAHTVHCVLIDCSCSRNWSLIGPQNISKLLRHLLASFLL